MKENSKEIHMQQEILLGIFNKLFNHVWKLAEE
jgi:hypothetical protein